MLKRIATLLLVLPVLMVLGAGCSDNVKKPGNSNSTDTAASEDSSKSSSATTSNTEKSKSTTTSAQPTTTNTTVAPRTNKLVMFTGDSITDAGREKPIKTGMKLGSGYVSLVANQLQSALPAKGKKVPELLNSGVSGNDIKQLTARFEKDVDAFSPDILVMMIGINDAYIQWNDIAKDYTPELFKSRLENVFRRWASQYSKVVLITPFYIEKHSESKNRKDYLDRYVTAMKAVANKQNNCVLIDMDAIFDAELDKIGWDKFAQLTPDRVHLTNKGNEILANEVTKILVDLC